MTLIFNLPLEVRQNIWRIYYSTLAIPRQRYAGDFGGTETSGSADISLILVCKQIYAEVLPVFYACLKLHIVYNPYSPGQLDTLPPPDVRNHIREILFHCSSQENWGRDRPPKRPFPFFRFPRLEMFRITKSTMIPIRSLHEPTDDNDENDSAATAASSSQPLTRSTYEELSVEDRVKAWKRSGVVSAERIIRDVADFGRAGWLSQVVDPKTHTEPVRLEPDSDSEFDDEDWQEWTRVEDSTWRYRYKEVLKDEEKLSLLREVIGRMRTIIELEYKLWQGDGPWSSNVFAVFLVTVDARDRRVLEYRLLDREELDFRREWAGIAT